MALTTEKTTAIYEAIILKAQKQLDKGNYYKSLKYIISASFWMYSFNTIYTDKRAEEMLHMIAKSQLPKFDIANPNANRAVFIDYFGWDNRGLTQQYLRGIMKSGKEILFILHNSAPKENSEIIRELKEYNKATIKIYTSQANNYIEIAGKIANDIYEFAPKDILLHIAPWDVTSLMAIDNITGVTKYNVNLTDHAYWMGASFIDYNIEFRGHGELLSRQKRGLKESQQIRLPYYPVVSKYTEFQGFPELPKDCVKIFCGGSQYKMLGKEDIFFKMMDGILDTSDKAQILVAGVTEDSIFGQKVTKMRNRDRVHIIGVRKDINDVYAHSDIFLGTYPIGGGLMTQYAALNRLPILAYDKYNSQGVHAMVNHFASPLKSMRTLDELFAYAKRLIESKELRVSEGKKCHDAMMDKDKFADYLSDCLTNYETDISWELEQPDYKYMVSFYLDVENNYTHDAIKTLYAQLKWDAIKLAPEYVPFITKFVCKKIVKKLSSSRR